jgi:hypothetical protein
MFPLLNGFISSKMFWKTFNMNLSYQKFTHGCFRDIKLIIPKQIPFFEVITIYNMVILISRSHIYFSKFWARFILLFEPLKSSNFSLRITVLLDDSRHLPFYFRFMFQNKWITLQIFNPMTMPISTANREKEQTVRF